MSFGGIHFLQPFWFLLLIPLGCALYLWRTPSKFLTVVRALVVLFVLLAMAGPVLKLPSRSGTVIVVADRSLSMPPEARENQIMAINLLQETMGKDDRLGVVSFAERPFTERAPRSGEMNTFGTFTSESANDASDLSAALDQAISLIPPEDKGRIFIISDGRWTGENPNRLISRLLQNGISVDYRVLERSNAGDVAVLGIESPGVVLPREAFTLNAWIRVPVTQEIEYELLREDKVISSGKRSVSGGDERLVFRDIAGRPGAIQYTLRIRGAGADPVPENNTARRIVGVEGTRPLLILAQKGVSRLGEVFEAAGIESEVRDPSAVKWDLPTLSAYSGILLENLPAAELSQNGMMLIADWVRQTGTGLMMTGGQASYATGGYYKSPLDEILPVSMELRHEHRKLSVAICAVLDTSGSMGVGVGGGKIKMDLAKLGAAEIPRVLTAMDEISVIGFDNKPRYLVPLEQNLNPEGARQRILQPGPLEYGIFAYDALECAIREISKANAQTKHIILFADADHVVEPGNYKQLLGVAKQAGITCSCIGLGTINDTDAKVLMDIAVAGGGQCYFTDQPTELPRLFAQDTMVVARSTFIEEPTKIRITGMAGISSLPFRDPPDLGGYNLCYLKTEKEHGKSATQHVRSIDDYNAPIVATWQVGLGRALCFTGQADGKFTGDIAQWKDYNSFLSSLARWTAGRSDSLPNNMLVTQEVVDGSCHIRLHLDPESEEGALNSIPSIEALRQSPGKPLARESYQLRWLEPEMLGVTVPLTGSETLLAALTLNDVAQTPAVPLPPVCLPYSPEFRPLEAGKGRDSLRLLAEASGGVERVELTNLWKDIPRVPRLFDVSKWLIFAAIFFFVLEIFQRRTGWITAWWKILTNRLIHFWYENILGKPRPVKRPATLGGETIRTEEEPEIDQGKDKSLSWLEKISISKARRGMDQKPDGSGVSASKPGDQAPNQTIPASKTSSASTEDGGMLSALAKAKRSAQQRKDK